MSSELSKLPVRLQDMPPKWAHFCLGVEKFITNDLGVDLNGKDVLVAFSGGLDSTALLLALSALSERMCFRVVAAHVHHGLREEADRDAESARKFCSRMQVPFHLRKYDVSAMAEAQGVGIEEAGRNARYAFFAELMEKEALDLLAVGHHLDDLCEDILMRLSRGTGWPALSGMSGYDPRRNLFRPLLMATKSQLSDFCNDLSIDWQEDASNSDLEWKRNRVRHTLLPLLLEENPNFHEAAARMWQMGRVDQEYWEGELARIPSSSLLENSLLENAGKALRLRLFKRELDALGPLQALADTLFKLDVAWVQKRVGSVFQFPGNKTAEVASKGIVFRLKH